MRHTLKYIGKVSSIYSDTMKETKHRKLKYRKTGKGLQMYSDAAGEETKQIVSSLVVILCFLEFILGGFMECKAVFALSMKSFCPSAF